MDLQSLPSRDVRIYKREAHVSNLSRFGVQKGGYSSRGNVISISYEKYYVEPSGSRFVYETGVMVERLNKSVPESSELLPSTKVVAPFFGPVEDPTTFGDWEGFSEAVFEELNRARVDPPRYAEHVQRQLETFQDGLYVQGGKTTMAVEGEKAWLEAIDFLKGQRPVGALRRVRCLDCAAQFMVEDSSANAIIGHIDSQDRADSDRVEAACLVRYGGENIAYGMRSARGAVVQLIVDDNVADRGHRSNLFRNYTQVGVASGYYEHRFETITVHDFLF